MSLRKLLLEHQAAIASRWLDKTIATYPRDAAAFFAKGKDRFANPVGAALKVGTEGVLRAVLEQAEPSEVCGALEPMIKVRSVQEFTPARAVSFIFLLKTVVREELAESLRDPKLRDELADFDSQVDQVALYAFDVYTKCRDHMHQLRINDVKRRVSGLMRRMGIGLDDLEPQADGDGGPELTG